MARTDHIIESLRVAQYGLTEENPVAIGNDWLYLYNDSGDNVAKVRLSVMSALMLEIAKGNVTGHASVNKFGRNTDVDTAEEDVWDGGGTWVAPTAARLHDIASTSASDASAGVGARTIEVYGLTSWTTAEVSETITMNGTTNVPTVNSYVIIHRMKVLTKGATDVNVGIITATAQTDSTVTAQINASEGQTQMAVYGVPSTQSLYLTRMYGSLNKSGPSGGVDLALLWNPEPDAELTNFQVKSTRGLALDGTSSVDAKPEPPAGYDGPGILKISAIGSAINNDVSAGFDGILVID